jgi:hypothetical protein
VHYRKRALPAQPAQESAATESLPKLDSATAQRIAALFGAPLEEAAYRAGGQPVYTVTLPSSELGIAVTLLLWIGLGRADIRLGASSFVFKRIDAIELYPGVEVLFRRLDPPGYMFLSVSGRASLVI